MKKVHPFELVIRPKTPREEYNYLWFVLEHMPFYRERKYSVELLNNPTFMQLADVSPHFDGVDREALFSVFTGEVYEPDFFRRGVEVLEESRPRIEQSFPIFDRLNKQWGFKLFPRYQLCLTHYGPGGSYSDDGVVTMMTRADGTFRRQDPGATAVHEMIHIGIEQPIVMRFGLDHWEKERLVDCLCKTTLGSVLPDYKMQAQGDTRIDQYVIRDNVNSLPQAIEKYVADYPRT